MTARLEVGHVQTLQANLASGCLHFLKNCTKHTLDAESPFLFCAYSAPTKPRAMTAHTVDTVWEPMHNFDHTSTLIFKFF